MSTTLLETLQHHIAGATTAGTSERTAPVYDPATGQVQRHVPLAEPADVDAAVAAAKRAFVEWSGVSVTRRARVMFKFRELINEHTDELARIISAEHGKTFDDAKGEVVRGMEVVEYACGIAELTKGEFSDQVSTGVDLHSFRQPLGVCAGITPFNFPIMVPMWMHPVAIATGTRSCSSRPSATRASPTGSPSCTPRPVCRTACSTSCTATRSRSTRCSTTPTWPR